jgi:nucleotide-binding universal stress UspA family protein
MIKIANVLVATDFGEASTTALAYGRELARTFGARLHVLHVVENPMLWVGPETAGIDVMRLQAELEAAAQKQLDRLVTAEDREQPAVTIIRTGRNVAVEVANHASWRASMSSSWAHTAARSPGDGSVAEKVVRIAPCPVLTVRHPEHEFILPDALQLERVRR